MFPPSVSFFRILCVDDDRMFQEMLKNALESHGFEVIVASHGVDSLAQYKAHCGEFGGILSSHEMPGKEGLAFVSLVRALGYQGRIVIMSGNLTASELRKYSPYRINGFFTKPFEFSLLAGLLGGDDRA